MGLRQRIVLAAVLPTATLLVGCSTTDELFTSTPAPTEIAIDPSDFLGGVPCGSSDNAMKSYVVTLRAYDNEDDVTPFVLGSSFPTSCAYVAAFRDVIVAGKLYTAEVDGYDVLASTLTPFGDESSGARQMRDELGEIVLPRWTTQCGAGPSEAATAATNQTRYIGNCNPLSDASPTPTQISIPASAVLGDDPCGVAATFDIEGEQGALGDASAVPCDGAPLLYEVNDSTEYRFYATAETSAGHAGSECFAFGSAGETVNVLCQPLSTTGQIELSLAGLSSDDTAVCPAGAFYDVLYGGGSLNAVPLSCAGHTTIGPFLPDVYVFSTAVYDAEGAPLGSGASCGAQVRAGKTVPALCNP